MNVMTLPSRHRIRNSNAVGVRPRTQGLPLVRGGSQQYTSERGKNIFFFLKLDSQSGVRNRDRRHSKQAALTTAPGPLP